MIFLAGNKLDVAIAAKDVEAGADPVTQADLQAQQVIEGSLHHHFPSLRIIGEEDIDPSDFLVVSSVNRNLLADKTAEKSEFSALVPIEDVTIYIDPLDATAEFVLGNKQSPATLIGIALKNVAYGGVMHQPFEGTGQGRTLWAMQGFGCGDDMEVKEKNILHTRTLSARTESVLVTTRSHSTGVTEDAIKKLAMDTTLRVGGAGYKVLLLIDGTADVYCYPTPGTKKWDTCAPEAILNYLGGKMTDSEGNDIDYANTEELHNKKGVFAAVTAEMHKKYLDKLHS